MSILIKGMEMPKYCDVCPFEMERKTRDGDGITYCVITREVVRWWMNDRHESSYGKCPLIELPPHGRLIDADELSKEIQTLQKYRFSIEDPEIFVSRKAVMQAIIDNQTVIEAEEGTG